MSERSKASQFVGRRLSRLAAFLISAAGKVEDWIFDAAMNLDKFGKRLEKGPPKPPVPLTPEGRVRLAQRRADLTKERMNKAIDTCAKAEIALDEELQNLSMHRQGKADAE